MCMQTRYKRAYAGYALPLNHPDYQVVCVKRYSIQPLFSLSFTARKLHHYRIQNVRYASSEKLIHHLRLGITRTA